MELKNTRYAPLARIAFLLYLLPFTAFAQVEIGSQKYALPRATDTTTIALRLNQVRKNIMTLPAPAALDSLNDIITQSLHSGFGRGVVYGYLHKAKIYYSLGNSTLFLRVLDQAISYGNRYKEGQPFLPLLYNETGWAYVQHDNYEQATAYLLKAHDLAQKGIDGQLKASISLNLTAVMLLLSQYQQATRYLAEAKHLSGGEHMEEERVRTHLFQSILACEKDKDLVSGKQQLETAITVARKHHLSEFLQMALVNLATLYLKTNEPASALPLLEEALNLSQEAGAIVNVGGMATLGETYLKLGQLDRAEALLREALQQSRLNHYHKDNLVHIHHVLAELYEARKDYRKALWYKDRYIALKDSISGNQVKESINQLEMQYHSAQKNKQLAENKLMIALQQSHLSRKNTWIFWGTLTSGLVLFMVVFFYRQKQKNIEYKLKAMEQQEAIKAWQATLKGEEQERARVAHELHDGIGGQLFTLNMYLSAAREECVALQEAPSYQASLLLLKETMQDLRNTAHNMMPELLVHSGLAEALQLYCHKVKQTRQIDINFQQYGNMDKLDHHFELSLYHIVRELIQNILKHAQATKALVQFSCHDSFLNITVEDNGKGMKTGAEAHEGMGMKTITSRIKAMNGTCSFQTGNTGTVVYLEFDLQSKATALKTQIT